MCCLQMHATDGSVAVDDSIALTVSDVNDQKS